MMEIVLAISGLVGEWFGTKGVVLLRNIVVFSIVLASGYLISRALRRTVALAIKNSKLKPSPLFQHFAVNAVEKVTFFIALIIALGHLGVDTSALIAGLGVSGLVLGFALKDTLSNFASGMLILLYRPFDVGHLVEIGGMQGTVRDLTLVSTILRTSDNKQVLIPNSKVWGNPLTNFSATGQRRIQLKVGISYEADIDEATELLLKILRQNIGILADPAPQILVDDLGDSSVDLVVRGWVKTKDYSRTRSQLLRGIKYGLDEAGVEIPYPQQVVRIVESMAEGEVR